MTEIPIIEGEIVDETTKESVRLIQKEIEKITDENIKNFTYQAFAEVDPKFWISPSSSTGKYHPEEDNGEGGLVRHVVKGIAVVEQYLRREMATLREIDIAKSAFLLHDTCKNGVVWESSFTNYTHGFIAAKWLEKFDLTDESAKQEIINAVRYHMGQWSYVVSPFEDRPYTKEEMMANVNEIIRALHPSKIERAVQDADYWASRQSMSFFPGVTVDFRQTKTK